MTLWSILVVYLYYRGGNLGWIRVENLAGLDPVIHTLLGTVLGFLIVFCVNALNNRYWVGRSYWGMLNNTFAWKKTA